MGAERPCRENTPLTTSAFALDDSDTVGGVEEMMVGRRLTTTVTVAAALALGTIGPASAQPDRHRSCAEFGRVAVSQWVRGQLPETGVVNPGDAGAWLSSYAREAGPRALADLLHEEMTGDIVVEGGFCDTDFTRSLP